MALTTPQIQARQVGGMDLDISDQTQQSFCTGTMAPGVFSMFPYLVQSFLGGRGNVLGSLHSLAH